MSLALGIILLIAAVFLVVAVLLQQGKNNGLGAISGGGDTYYGQGKTMTKDKILSRLTTVVAIAFCIIVLVVFVFQGKKPESTNAPAASTGDDTSATVSATLPAATESATQAATEAATEAK